MTKTNKLAFQQKHIRLLVVTSLAFLLLFFVLALRKSYEQRRLATESVRLQLYTLNLEKALYGRVASYRAYLLSGNGQFKAALDTANMAIDTLSKLMSAALRNDALQAGRVDSGMAIIRMSEVLTDTGIALVERGAFIAAAKHFSTGIGQVYLDSGRRVLFRFSAREQQKLQSRMKAAKQAELSYLLIQGCILVVLILFSILYVRSRKREAAANQKLAQHELRCSLLQDTLRQALLITDGAGTIESVNAMAEALLCQSSTQLEGRSVVSLFAKGAYQQHMEAALRQPGALKAIIALKGGHPRRRFFEVATTPILAADGSPEGALHFLEDVTENIAQRSQMKAWNNRLFRDLRTRDLDCQASLNRVQDAVLQFSHRWHCSFANERARHLPFLHPEKLPGAHIKELFAECFAEQVHIHLMLTAYQQRERSFVLRAPAGGHSYHCRTFPRQMGTDLFICEVADAG